jgi:hypothetical protein
VIGVCTSGADPGKARFDGNLVQIVLCHQPSFLAWRAERRSIQVDKCSHGQRLGTRICQICQQTLLEPMLHDDWFLVLLSSITERFLSGFSNGLISQLAVGPIRFPDLNPCHAFLSF